MVKHLRTIWLWILVSVQLPRAYRQLRDLRKQHPDLFQKNDDGHTGLSFFSPPMRVIALARSMRTFAWTHGTWPDLVHPKLLTEKILARKFVLRMKAPVVEDKLNTFKFARAVGVSSPKLISTSSTPDDLLKSLPNAGQVFVKLNRGSGTNCAVDLPLTEPELADLIARMTSWTKINGRLLIGEWWNTLISPHYLAEFSETHTNGQFLEDWKFFVVRGRVIFVQYDSDRFGDHHSLYLDRAGQRSQISMAFRPTFEGHFDLPSGFAEMIEKAEALGAMFDLVRVDFYLKDDGTILLGELTIAPNSGHEPILPLSENLRLGTEYDLQHGQPAFDPKGSVMASL